MYIYIYNVGPPSYKLVYKPSYKPYYKTIVIG